MRVAGVMSGTSLDGIDVAIVEVEESRDSLRQKSSNVAHAGEGGAGFSLRAVSQDPEGTPVCATPNTKPQGAKTPGGAGIQPAGLGPHAAGPNRLRIKTIGFQSISYPGSVRAAILAVSNTVTETRAISRLNFQLGELYARAVLRAIRRFGPVELIGCHGQTIFHEGSVSTLQIGEAAVLAERTGIPVVSNFRARDIAAGGQGAPLVPYADYLLFRHPRRTRVALNIGGIANITVIPAAASPEDVVAFDTGPGNMAIDALAREFTRGKLNCDLGGKIAASGHVNTPLLETLLAEPYYRRNPPKSAGREQYGAEFVARMMATGAALPDLIATATALTAASVAIGIRQACSPPAELIVSGGGTHNAVMMAHLAGFLPGFAMSTSTDQGIDADAKEAIAFAILAHQSWRRKPSNLPAATGARKAVILGDITP